MNEAALQVCKNLIKEFNLDDDWYIYERDRTGGKSSIGVEVEVKWRDYFPELYEKYLKGKNYSDLTDEEKTILTEECNEREVGLLRHLERTVKCGIPRGADRYWEFAFVPTTIPFYTATQIEILRERRLIPDRGSHSLHITIGNLESNRDAYYMLMILELLYSSKERISEGFNKQNPKLSAGWSKKGYAGIFNKEAYDLEYGASKAIELRTLCINPNTNVYEMLERTQLLADIIHDKQNDITNILIPRWDVFVNVLSKKLVARGMTDANWKKPHQDPTNWNLFIEHFEDLQNEIKITWRDFEENMRRAKQPHIRIG